MHAGLRIDEAIVRQWFFLIRCESEDNLSYRLTLTGSRIPSQFGYAASIQDGPVSDRRRSTLPTIEATLGTSSCANGIGRQRSITMIPSRAMR